MNTSSVIKHYREKIFKHTKRLPLTPSDSDEGSIAVAHKYLAWCAQHHVDPLKFMDLRFDQMCAFKRLPGFRSLASASLINSAQKVAASDDAASTLIDCFTQQVSDLARMTPGQEQVRRRYCFQSTPELCLANQMSGGFDPRSHYCPTCPQAGACAVQLNQRWGFDVISLRLGRLDHVPTAVRHAAERGTRGGIPV